MEWLSVLVEDCLSSTSHCLPLVSSATKPLAKTLIGEIDKFPQQKNPNFCPQDSVEAPSKARGKRKRAQITKNPLAFWFHQLNPDGIFVVSTDPPLLQQEHWLADSELIVTKAGEQDQNALEQAEETEGEGWKNRALIDHKEGGGGEFVAPTDKKALRNIKDMGCTEHEAGGQYRKKNDMGEVEVEVEMEGGGGGDEVSGPRKGKDQKAHRNIGEEEEWHGGDMEEPDGQTWKKAKGGGVHHSPSQGHNQGGTRRCSHCLAHKTPQWRAGPMGPKTLCNACGVRYKSGRLLPEYRPAKSPTFVSYLHSNSHKKVMEMRTSLFS